MGGHSDGAKAAETAIKVLVEAFWHTPQPILDPLGFLHLTLGRAHEEVVKLGIALPLEARPRATCAVCLVQNGSAYWAHIGDSRIYLLRRGKVLKRTRDHSHVEFLLREGVITQDQALSHPMRNFVECCLGGEAFLPEMTRLAARAARDQRHPAGLLRWPVGRPRRQRHRQRFPAGTRAAARRARAPGGEIRGHRRRRQRQHHRRGGALDRKRLMSARPSGRAADELRAVRFTRQFTQHAEGSVLVEFGSTRVLCTASVEEIVPGFLRGKNQGWVTAEYGMLPRATHTRSRARSGQGQAERAHAGNPAPHRPLVARGHQSRRARRTHHHARLRRAAGRRRYAHGGDHRQLRGAGRRLRCAAGAKRAHRGVAAARPGGRGLGRHLQAARPCSISTTPKIPPPRPT